MTKSCNNVSTCKAADKYKKQGCKYCLICSAPLDALDPQKQEKLANSEKKDFFKHSSEDT